MMVYRVLCYVLCVDLHLHVFSKDFRHPLHIQ